jgi:hypothetical protein
MPFNLRHSSSFTQIISTGDAKLDVVINTPCSPSPLLVDSNLFQEKVIKNKEEALVLERSVVILEAGNKRPQLSLVDIQGTLTASSGNGRKTTIRIGNKATSKPTTCSLQAGVKTSAKEVTKK